MKEGKEVSLVKTSKTITAVFWLSHLVELPLLKEQLEH